MDPVAWGPCRASVRQRAIENAIIVTTSVGHHDPQLQGNKWTETEKETLDQIKLTDKDYPHARERNPVWALR